MTAETEKPATQEEVEQNCAGCGLRAETTLSNPSWTNTEPAEHVCVMEAVVER